LRGELTARLPHPDPAKAEDSFRTALAIAREQGTRGYELRAAASLARLWCDQGRRAEARDLLAPVYGWFTEGFDTPDLKDAEGLLDELNSVRENVGGSHRKPKPADAPRRARSTSIARRSGRSSAVRRDGVKG
jgi:predicted ATPase